VVVAMIFFRSPTLTSAFDLMKGLVAQNGVALPQAIYDHLGPLATWFHQTTMKPELWSGHEFGKAAMWIFAGLFIALACPNTQQILARYEPALGVTANARKFAGGRVIEWSASLPWAIGVSIVAGLGMLSLSGPSEFLYWQF